jgi:hypothetical protein
MKPEIKNIDGIDHLIVAIPLHKPELSKTEKSNIVAKTGFKNTTLTVHDKPLTYSALAFIPL